MGRGVGVAVGTREMRDWPQVGVRSREREREQRRDLWGTLWWFSYLLDGAGGHVIPLDPLLLSLTNIEDCPYTGV